MQENYGIKNRLNSRFLNLSLLLHSVDSNIFQETQKLWYTER